MYGIVVHGGAGGTSPRARRGVKNAAMSGRNILRDGGSGLEAAITAVFKEVLLLRSHVRRQ